MLSDRALFINFTGSTFRSAELWFSPERCVCMCIKGHSRRHVSVWAKLQGGKGIWCDLAGFGMLWKAKSASERNGSWKRNQHWACQLPSGVAHTAPRWHANKHQHRRFISLRKKYKKSTCFLRVCKSCFFVHGFSLFQQCLDLNEIIWGSTRINNVFERI